MAGDNTHFSPFLVIGTAATTEHASLFLSPIGIWLFGLNGSLAFFPTEGKNRMAEK